MAETVDQTPETAAELRAGMRADRADLLKENEKLRGICMRLLAVWDPEWEPGKSLHTELVALLQRGEA